jgi:hypothetical protein
MATARAGYTKEAHIPMQTFEKLRNLSEVFGFQESFLSLRIVLSLESILEMHLQLDEPEVRA